MMYRYEDRLVGDEDSTWVVVSLKTFQIIKITLCGVWIDLGFGRKRFVNLKCRKQYACQTKEQAKVQFIARKKCQISILNGRMSRAQRAIQLVEFK